MPVTSATLRKRALKRNFILKLRDVGYFGMEPGLYPLERVSTANVYENESPYLHSSIEGFNKEYQKLGKSLQIVAQFKDLRQKVIDLGQQMATNLLQRSRAAKKQIFGIESNADIMTAPAVQLLYNQGILSQLRSELLELKLYAMDPNKINNLQILKQHQAQIMHLKAQTIEQRAEEMRKRIEDTLNWINEKDPEQKLKQTDLINFLQDTVQQLNQQVTPFGLRYKSDINTDPVNFHSKLGYVFESMLEGYFATCVQEALSEEVLMKKIKGTGLNDLISGTELILDIDQKITDKLSLTAKFRGTNAFEIHAENPIYKKHKIVAPRSIKNILDSQGITNLQGLSELQYFYNNWVALSIFSSENDTGLTPQTWQKDSRKSEAARERKRGQGLLTGSSFKQVFTALADYIYIVLITQALYGNSVDYNNNATTPIIDKDYMPTLLDKTVQKQHTPPAFLFTSQRVFETGLLFQMILDNARKTNEHENDTIHDSIKALFDAFATRSSYSAVPFEELYREKCEALIAASNSKESTTIYDTLFDKDVRTIHGFNPFKSWFTRDMAFRITFDPSKYIR